MSVHLKRIKNYNIYFFSLHDYNLKFKVITIEYRILLKLMRIQYIF